MFASIVFKIKTFSFSITNKLYCDYTHWQILLSACPLKWHVREALGARLLSDRGTKGKEQGALNRLFIRLFKCTSHVSDFVGQVI